MAAIGATRRIRAIGDDQTTHEFDTTGYIAVFEEMEKLGYPLDRIVSLDYWSEYEKCWVSADDLLAALTRP